MYIQNSGVLVLQNKKIIFYMECVPFFSKHNATYSIPYGMCLILIRPSQ